MVKLHSKHRFEKYITIYERGSYSSKKAKYLEGFTTSQSARIFWNHYDRDAFYGLEDDDEVVVLHKTKRRKVILDLETNRVHYILWNTTIAIWDRNNNTLKVTYSIWNTNLTRGDLNSIIHYGSRQYSSLKHLYFRKQGLFYDEIKIVDKEDLRDYIILELDHKYLGFKEHSIRQKIKRHNYNTRERQIKYTYYPLILNTLVKLGLKVRQRNREIDGWGTSPVEIKNNTLIVNDLDYELRGFLNYMMDSRTIIGKLLVFDKWENKRHLRAVCLIGREYGIWWLTTLPYQYVFSRLSKCEKWAFQIDKEHYIYAQQ